jgi:chloramphenicol 3-O phosphotransferase
MIPPGKIIVLNGTSSSGKTSLVAALQELLEEPYLDVGLDKFLWMLPKRYLNEPAYWREVFIYHWPEGGGPEGLVIETGPRGHRLVSGMHQAIAVLAWTGNNVIADHVLLEPAWVQECAELFADLPALFVGVRCPLEVVEQRERARGNRTLGQARAQFYRVHGHGLYDFEVDTSQHDSQACALAIKQWLESNPYPVAFKQLKAAITRG